MSARRWLGVLAVLGLFALPGLSDETYSGKYHPHFVVNSWPLVQVGEANLWMAGEPLQATQTCGGGVNGQTMAVASWYYPCGTKLRVWSLKTGRSVTVSVTDRGPDLMQFPNNVVDVTPLVAQSIGHESGGLILVTVWLP